MALNDPFTLDLFGNTSLSSGLGFGVTAFPAAGEPDDADRAVSSTTPAPPFRSRLPLRSRRSFAARISISTATAGLRRAGAIARERTLRDPACGGRSRPNVVRHRRGAGELIRFAGFGASELANGVFRRPGEDASAKAGRRSAESSSALSTPGPTPRSRAARSTPTSRRNTSSERSGRL